MQTNIEQQTYPLEARGLNLYYKDFHALINISLAIREKAVTAIIGPSGCGKSTFLRCFNRINDTIPGVRIEGQVLVDGRNIYEAGIDLPQLRKKVGMVFQHPTPFPLSVFENITYGPRVHGERDKSRLTALVERSLEQVHLWDELKGKLDSLALELSPEQQQRLCIARLLAVKPEIILMDEPCSSLDPVATMHLEDLLRELAQKYTILIVTHNMQQAARVSDYAAFFCLGELIEYNTTSKIFSNPSKKETEDYVTGKFG